MRKAFFQSTSWTWRPKWKQRMRWDYACHGGHVHVVIHYKQNHVGRTTLLKAIPRNLQGGKFCWPVRAEIRSREIILQAMEMYQLLAYGIVRRKFSIMKRFQPSVPRHNTNTQQTTPKALYLEVFVISFTVTELLHFSLGYKYRSVPNKERNSLAVPHIFHAIQMQRMIINMSCTHQSVMKLFFLERNKVIQGITFIIIWCVFSFLFTGQEHTTWPVNNVLQITVCSCVV